MATLSRLEADEDVFLYDPGLEPGVQPERLVYLLPRVRKWMEETLPGLEPEWFSEIQPIEQLAIFLEDFCAGKELTVGPSFSRLDHVSDFVWKLKTDDLRLFGWFVTRDCFVVARANTATLIKRLHLYRAIGDEVVRDHADLPLDEPKAILGDDPHAVVSNYHFP